MAKEQLMGFTLTIRRCLDLFLAHLCRVSNPGLEYLANAVLLSSSCQPWTTPERPSPNSLPSTGEIASHFYITERSRALIQASFVVLWAAK